MRTAFVGTLILLGSLPASTTADDKEAEIVKTMRSEVQKNVLANVVLDDLFSSDGGKSFAAGRAYKKLFSHVGLAGLKALAEDEDTGIALQAALELHKKVVKRDTPIPNRTNWVFDKKPMEEFLKFAAKRLKTEPPAWWGAVLVKGEVFPDSHHAFITKNEGLLPATAKVKVEKDEVVLTSGKQSVKVPKVVFGKVESDLDSPPVILCGESLSFIARPVCCGHPYDVICVDSKTGKKQWAAPVWASCHISHTGPPSPDYIEIRRHEDTVIVYGCEIFSVYAEAFDAKTGKCQFRFCTCYWGFNSEQWGLK
jgi:hypothetical protein